MDAEFGFTVGLPWLQLQQRLTRQCPCDVLACSPLRNSKGWWSHVEDPLLAVWESSVQMSTATRLFAFRPAVPKRNPMSAPLPGFVSCFLNESHSEWEESLVDSHCSLVCISWLVSDIKHFVWMSVLLFFRTVHSLPCPNCLLHCLIQYLVCWY